LQRRIDYLCDGIESHVLYIRRNQWWRLLTNLNILWRNIIQSLAGLKNKKHNKFCYSCSCMDRGVENNWLMYNICITWPVAPPNVGSTTVSSFYLLVLSFLFSFFFYVFSLVSFSTSVIILLISNFLFSPFNHSTSIYQILFSLIWFLLFWFLFFSMVLL
jgi:hypothetical protein